MSSIEYISSQTLVSQASVITFNNIPNHFNDLIITARVSRTASVFIGVRFNGLSSGYSCTRMYGDGSTTASTRGTTAGITEIGGPIPTNTGRPIDMIINVFNYSNSNMLKTILLEDLWASVGVGSTVGVFHSTSAINSAELTSYDGTFEVGSVATIWGVR